MAEFDIKGVTYRSGKMTGLTQVHVLRRAAPVIKPLFTVMASRLAGGATAAANLEMASQVIDGLGNLEDDKLNYILEKSLAVVEIKQDGSRWAPIKSSNGMVFMFEEIASNGLLMMAICTQVLIDNYFPLFLEAPELFSFGGDLGRLAR